MSGDKVVHLTSSFVDDFFAIHEARMGLAGEDDPLVWGRARSRSSPRADAATASISHYTTTTIELDESHFESKRSDALSNRYSFKELTSSMRTFTRATCSRLTVAFLPSWISTSLAMDSLAFLSNRTPTTDRDDLGGSVGRCWHLRR
jgi:hypothetical protein